MVLAPQLHVQSPLVLINHLAEFLVDFLWRYHLNGIDNSLG
jgi:hypothetical protein